MEFIYILAQAAQDAQASSPMGQSYQWLILILLFAGMWFLLIAPQRKKEKQRRQMLAQTKVGDEVITIGGIYGTITNKSEKTYTLRISDNTKIEILISAISDNLSQTSGVNK